MIMVHAVGDTLSKHTQNGSEPSVPRVQRGTEGSPETGVSRG